MGAADSTLINCHHWGEDSSSKAAMEDLKAELASQAEKLELAKERTGALTVQLDELNLRFTTLQKEHLDGVMRNAALERALESAAEANQASTAAEATRRAAELAEMQARVAAAHDATAASARELMAARAAAAAAEEKAAAAAGKAAELQRLNAALIVKLKEARLAEDRENTNGNKNATKDRLQQQQGTLAAGL